MSYSPPSVKQQTNNWAVVSLVLGILSWLFLPGIGAIGAIIFGHKAKREIRSNTEYFSGDGLATAGLALGYIQLGVAALSLIFILSFIGFNSSQILAVGNPSKNVNIPNIQNITVTTFDNQTYKLSDYQGKIVVINFWASWANPSREEAADLERVWQEYKDDGVVFFGQNYLDQDLAAKEYLNEWGITYPNGPDTRSKNSRMLQVSGIPATYIFDKNGMVSETLKGPTDYEILSAIIRRLLEK